jgi:tRNA (guanine-N7-)-methyltransferase
MGRKNKLRKFADILSFPNVYENFFDGTSQLIGVNGQHVDLRGDWNKRHFDQDKPITLELACGRGEYCIALAEQMPERHFIGLDVKGARIWLGASRALEKGLANVVFLRTRIEMIADFFHPAEVDELWITFPDPFLRDSKENRRLTSPYFLNLYRKILKPGGLVHLKTDSPELYEFTLKIIARDEQCNLLVSQDDIYSEPLIMPELETKTYYEHMHLLDGRKIKYIRFTIG